MACSRMAYYYYYYYYYNNNNNNNNNNYYYYYYYILKVVLAPEGEIQRFTLDINKINFTTMLDKYQGTGLVYNV